MLNLIFRTCVLFVVLGSFQMEAQSRRRDPNGGVFDRSIGSGQRQNTHRKVEPVDYTKLAIDNLTEKLALDGFQNAVLKKIMEDYNQKTLSITEQSIPNEAKFEQIKTEKSKTDALIIDMLNEKQKVAFEALKKSNKDKSKKKKNKKKKNSEPEETENELF